MKKKLKVHLLMNTHLHTHTYNFTLYDVKDCVKTDAHHLKMSLQMLTF